MTYVTALILEPVYETLVAGQNEADPHWRYTDRAGHEHSYRHGYPTLEMIVDQSHWCDGSEGMFDHDQHEHVDKFHYVCGQCGERIKPGQMLPGTPYHIFLHWAGNVEAVLDAGVTVRFRLTSEEAATIAQLHGDQEAQMALAREWAESATERWDTEIEVTR